MKNSDKITIKNGDETYNYNEWHLLKEPETPLKKALNHPIWKQHKRNQSVYFMDGKPDRWKLVYYPIFQHGKTQEFYDEPRALMQNIDKDGFWSKEVPLRYLKNN